jgi:hypothetical protein
MDEAKRAEIEAELASVRARQPQEREEEPSDA